MLKLPVSLGDTFKPLADVLNGELERLSTQTKLSLHLPRLDELPHKILDELAYQFDAIFYQPENMNIEVKREIIATSLLQHMKLGTKYAVEKLLNTIARGAKIHEWFEYDTTRPYYFKLDLKGLPDFGDEGEILISAINATKNVRSWLDAIDFILTRPNPDEIFYVAILGLFLGEERFNLADSFELKEKLRVVQSELTSGSNDYDLEFKTRADLALQIFHCEIIHGRITIPAETESDDWYALWLKWIVSRWKKYARLIWYDVEEPIDLPEPETLDGNFLKLRISYHKDDCTRLIVIKDPRDDITADDINAVPVDGLFINRRGNLSDRVVWASTVRKTITKLL